MSTKESQSSFSILSLSVLVSIISIASFWLINYSDYNYHGSKSYRLYGKSTAYSVGQREFIEYFNLSINTKDLEEVRDCKRKMLFFVGRHSIRYPSWKKIIALKKLLPELREQLMKSYKLGTNNLNPKEMENFIKWKFRFVDEDDNRISDTGFNETQSIAIQFFNQFPDLLNFSQTDINVGVTYESRTKETAQAFLQGLNMVQPYFNVNINDEPAAYFHRTCKKILGDRLKVSEMRFKLEKSELAQQIVSNVLQLTGITEDLNFQQVHLIHVACAFEFALFGDSPWCSLFSHQDLIQMEFFHDIDEYYTDGHGLDLNQKMACPLIVKLNQAIKGSLTSEKKQSTLLFTHAGAIQRIWTYLGLFEKLKVDEKLNPDPERHWRTSLIVPFNANLALIVYDCNGNHKLLSLIHGIPITIRGCSKSICSLEEFISHHEEQSLDCDLNEICKPRGKTQLQH